jgi:bacteriocin biosynthesis cyclodehydratase domain-containing protein
MKRRLALPFTVLTAPDRVRLVAGEEFRFTVSGPGIDRWLPGWLQTLDETTLEGEQRETARRLLERLASERLVDLAPVANAPGSPGERGEPGALATGGIRVLSQDRLDFDELTRFNADCLAARVPFLWLTTAPLGRGYISPVCLPDDGPCLICLLGHFRRLSPLPELYDELAAHARAGGAIPATPFPTPGKTMLEQLAAWKAERFPTAAAFALHVLEVATMEVTSHRVTVDPECPACRGRR